jgi:GNAT superfamily N-acetyltransferase
MTVTVRLATPADVPAALTLMRGLAAYEGYLKSFAVDEAHVQALAFEQSPPAMRLLLATLNDRTVIGLAVVQIVEFTFRARPTLYLKELYVDESHRSSGAGDALMRAVAALAVQDGCAIVKWQVARWNMRGRQFYERLGAHFDDEWIDCVLDADAITALTADRPTTD